MVFQQPRMLRSLKDESLQKLNHITGWFFHFIQQHQFSLKYYKSLQIYTLCSKASSFPSLSPKTVPWRIFLHQDLIFQFRTLRTIPSLLYLQSLKHCASIREKCMPASRSHLKVHKTVRATQKLHTSIYKMCWPSSAVNVPSKCVGAIGKPANKKECKSSPEMDESPACHVKPKAHDCDERHIRPEESSVVHEFTLHQGKQKHVHEVPVRISSISHPVQAVCNEGVTVAAEKIV